MPVKNPRNQAPYNPGRKSSLPKVYGDTPTFLGLPKIGLPEGASGRDVVFLGMPWEGAVTWGSYSGCELSVKTVRHASARYGTYLPEYDLDAAEHLSLADAGDVAVVPGDGPATMEALYQSAAHIIAAGARPFVFGGDHSYTPALVKALAEAAKGEVGVIHLDAHLDNLPEFEGDELPRCGPLHRIVNTPGVKAGSVVSFGIRGPRNSPLQMELAKEAGIRVMTMARVREKGFKQAAAEAIRIAHTGTSAVFLTICSDILDAYCNPGGAPDFGGLNPAELFHLAREAGRAGLAGMDFVEIYPLQDPANQSSHLCAWTMVYALSGLAAGPQKQV